MTTAENKQEWHRAFELGSAARRAGRKREANPFKGDWRFEAWEAGYDNECARRKSERDCSPLA